MLRCVVSSNSSCKYKALLLSVPSLLVFLSVTMDLTKVLQVQPLPCPPTQDLSVPSHPPPSFPQQYMKVPGIIQVYYFGGTHFVYFNLTLCHVSSEKLSSN